MSYAGERPDDLPDELPDLLDDKLEEASAEMHAAVRATLAEFDQPADSLIGKAVQDAVATGATSFIEYLRDPETPLDNVRTAFQELGAQEAREGRFLYRSLIGCQEAFRVALRWLLEVAGGSGASADCVGWLSLAAADHFALLTKALRLGYEDEWAKSSPTELRHRLLNEMGAALLK